MSKLDSLIRKRADERRQRARACALSVMNDAKERGIDISLVGSLAKGRFRVHSDVDLLVLGQMNPARRAEVERLVADRFRESRIPYDLIFAADIGPERLEELLDDIV